MKSFNCRGFFLTTLLLSFVFLVASSNSAHNETELVRHTRQAEDIVWTAIEIVFKFVLEAIKNYLFDKYSDNFDKMSPLLDLAEVNSTVSVASMFLYDDDDDYDDGECDDDDDRVKLIQEQISRMDSKLDIITGQISKLADKIDVSTHKIITMQKLSKFNEIIIDLKSAENQLNQIAASYSTNTTALIGALDHFISKYKTENYGFKLVSYLDTDFQATNSLVDDLIEHERQNNGETRWSTTAMMYNTYLKVLTNVIRENVILRTAIKLKGNITATGQDEPLHQLKSNLNDTMAMFVESLRNMGRKLNHNDTTQHLNLRRLKDDEVVRIKNWFQAYLEPERNVSHDGTCSRTCVEYSNVTRHHRGCNGTLISCSNIPREAYIVTRQSPQTDRIYTNLKMLGFGDDDSVGPNQEMFDYEINWFKLSICDTCFCFCDQHDSEHTTRRFYTKIIEAPPAHVVTGTRFIEKNHAIFLQIQVGKLLPIGMIDQSTVHWQKLPDDHDIGNYYTLSQPGLVVSFNTLYRDTELKDMVVTGFVFAKHRMGLKLYTIKRKILDFNLGILDGNESLSARDDKQYTSRNDAVSSLEYRIAGLNPDPKRQTMNITENVAVEFSIGDMDVDIMQTCVPYFDGSDVTFGVKVPLSDVRFIHYTNDDAYAGYIRPVLRSIDYNYFVFNNASKGAFKFV